MMQSLNQYLFCQVLSIMIILQKNLLGSQKFDLSDDETYSIFKSKKSNSSNFLKYSIEYDNYDGENAKNLIEHKEVNNEE